MAMCIHGGEFETCRFGCTFRSAEELRLENDQLKKEMNMNKQQNSKWVKLTKKETREFNKQMRRIQEQTRTNMY